MVGMLAAMPPPAPRFAQPGDARFRARGDACPGALRLHRADDGALARVRVPGGVLTWEQADGLRELAGRLGDGELYLTSRGNVQLRGLGAECGSELASRMYEMGLLPSERHERVRNVVASPLSGLDGLGARDVRPWLTALDTLVCASEEAAGLSGRFLFALDDGRGDVDALGADVTLRARGDGDAELRIGALESVALVPADEAPGAALLAAVVFLEAAGGSGGASGSRSASGSGAWRVAELADGGASLFDEVVRRLRAAGPPVALGTVPVPGGAPPALGVVAGPGDTDALSVGLPLGRADAVRWRALTDLARDHGAGELRLTPWRGVVVPGVRRNRAPGALDALEAVGLVTGDRSPWTGVGACVGRPGCAKSLADVQGDAAAALPVAPRADALPVHWSGCERRCGHPRGEWVDVVAGPDGGYRVSVVRDGGRTGESEHVTGDPAALATAVATARTPRT
ncbi:precorrin-3B synthase [Streptomyces sp. col6]|uniref:precorrin-3B synthase n=1 Tax=Streptomyces sp. col6 TaxID=2478958 RepID=UPI0011CD6F2F|nr:precorrin-3B synthase [Streptomyces sp. col6]TXR95180.1 precorrin-3B synthase [Streptomyces sp. col6]